MIVLTADERAAVEAWIYSHKQLGYTVITLDRNILPVLEKLVSLPSEKEVNDPYANRRTVVDGSDCFGGTRDQGITRKSAR